MVQDCPDKITVRTNAHKAQNASCASNFRRYIYLDSCNAPRQDAVSTALDTVADDGAVASLYDQLLLPDHDDLHVHDIRPSRSGSEETASFPEKRVRVIVEQVLFGPDSLVSGPDSD